MKVGFASGPCTTNTPFWALQMVSQTPRQDNLPPTFLARSLVFWSSTNLGIFWFCEPRWHVFGTSVAFFVWTTYVSLVGYRSVQQQKR